MLFERFAESSSGNLIMLNETGISDGRKGVSRHLRKRSGTIGRMLAGAIHQCQ